MWFGKPEANWNKLVAIPIAAVLPSKDMTVNIEALLCSHNSDTPLARHRPVNLHFY